MPNNKMMYYQTKDLPVVFIYICTSFETSMDKWITKVSVLKQPGIHIYLDDSVVCEVTKILSVGGFPSYAFIDNKGNYKPHAIPVNESTTSDTLRQLIMK